MTPTSAMTGASDVPQASNGLVDGPPPPRLPVRGVAEELTFAMFSHNGPPGICMKIGCVENLNIENCRASIDCCGLPVLCLTCYSESFIAEKLHADITNCPRCKEPWSLLSAGGE